VNLKLFSRSSRIIEDVTSGLKNCCYFLSQARHSAPTLNEDELTSAAAGGETLLTLLRTTTGGNVALEWTVALGCYELHAWRGNWVGYDTMIIKKSEERMKLRSANVLPSTRSSWLSARTRTAAFLKERLIGQVRQVSVGRRHFP